ncbi:MAG: glycosyltransferase family 2 protein [Bryobacteraceae bacterium]|nr:glycosyltransferase family 2 protein [Bryobacteraceae bacterium]
MPTTASIAVIIPYYQERSGVLSRSLASVFGQDVDPSVRIHIVVVDDASPVDPAGDIVMAGSPPPGLTIEVLRRANGGPGAARNTGLDAAVGRHDVIAFIDSDDTWRADHLSRALLGLSSGADLYFCDFCAQDHPNGYLQRTRFYEKLANPDVAGVDRISPDTDIWCCNGKRLAEWTAFEYLAQTSTIAYRTERLGHLRFSETLRLAGEDHVFFLDLALAATRASFSLACEVERGVGINVYERAHTWGDAHDLNRRIYNIGALRLLIARARWSAAIRRPIKGKLAEARRAVGFLLVRQLLRKHRLPTEALRLAWQCDKRTVLLAPFYAATFVAAQHLYEAISENSRTPK